MKLSLGPLLSSAVVVALALGGCAAPSSDGDEAESTEGAATSAQRAEDRSSSSYTGDEVWIFGGSNADVLLGCVTCSSYSSDSVLSSYGYGSEYGDTIWNDYGTYGSDYSSSSPWNEYASSPPKLYTKDKKTFYGVFTVNEYKSQRTHLDKAIDILEGGRDRRR